MKALRYDGKEYFWINDMHPRMIAHPIKPELDGRDLSEMKAALNASIEATRAGEAGRGFAVVAAEVKAA